MENLVSILKKFLKSEYDNVFLLKGDWGIGKTYFWNEHEDELKNVNDDYLYYSMVSLYGKKDTSDIYRKIMFNTETINEEEKSVSLVDRAKSLGKKASNFISQSPYIKDYVGDILIDYSISKINDSIIVLDDFERISTDNDKEISNQFDEVFGLVNDLKRKGNKVVIISNIENEYDELINHIEKNVDIEFLYDPEINTIIENIFGSKTYSQFLPKIKKVSTEIELKNMRAVKKLKRNIDFLLGRTSEITVKELLSDLTLYTLCKFGQIPNLPSYQYLVDSDRYSIFRHDDVEDEEKEAFRLANKYLTIHNNDIKDKILRLIDYGYLEKSETNFLKEHIEENVESRKRYQLYDDAWDYYHNNFKNETDEFIKLMYQGCKENLDQIDPRNFESSLNKLRELDEAEKAEELLDEYFEVNEDKFRQVLTDHPYRLPMAYEVKGEEMNKRFNLIRDESQEVRSILEIAKKVTYSDGWSPSDVTELASHSVDDYEEFIRTTESDDLNSYIKRLIQFGNYGNSSNEQDEIKEKTLEALTRICRDGELNKVRIEHKFDINC